MNTKQILREQKEIDDFLEKIMISKPKYLAIDLETTWFNKEKWSPLQLELDWIGLYDWVNTWFIVHNPNLDYTWFNLLIREIPLITHNWKFDITVLLNLWFITYLEDLTIHDTKILSFLHNENKSSHSLKDLALSILNKWEVTRLEDVGEKPVLEHSQVALWSDVQASFIKNKLSPWENKLWSYCMDDCIYTFELFHFFKKNMPSDRIWAVYEKIELPFLKTLIQMELKGILLDVEYLKEMKVKLQDKILESQIKVYKEAGTDFNVWSPKQIQEILQKLQIDIPEKYKTPKWWISTWVGCLRYLNGEGVKIAWYILEWREFSKLDTWFIDSLISKTIHWKIHCSFNQTGAITGRLSSSSPNLQNQPSRADEFDTRKAFKARDWHSFVISDLSQAELRILAHYSQEEVLLDAFSNWKDIHQATADRLWITRSESKAINFWVLYGMSAYGLAETLGITKIKAQDFINNYFSELPWVKRFIDTCYKTVEKQKYITTILGRHRNFPKYWIKTPYPLNATDEEKKKIRLQDFKDKSAMERQIVNSCVQGSAADYIKLAMRNCQRDIDKYGANILISIHDEIVVECKDKDISAVKQIVSDSMKNAIKLKWVPIEISLKTSKVWCK